VVWGIAQAGCCRTEADAILVCRRDVRKDDVPAKMVVQVRFIKREPQRGGESV
jgi:hypothetical protein